MALVPSQVPRPLPLDSGACLGETGWTVRARLLLSAVYFTLVGSLGAWGPYLAPFLDRTGHSGAAIGALLALVPLARMVSAPAWAAAADRFRSGTTLLRVGTVLSTLVAATIALGGLGPLALGLALIAFSALRAPLAPILDATAVEQLVAQGRDPRGYGRLRMWGSVGYLLLAALGALVAASADRPETVLLLAVGAFGLTAVLSFALPAADGPPPAPILPALRGLAGRPFLLPLLGALALHGVGLTAYDALLPMHLASVDAGGAWTAAALATGVSVEIAVMALGTHLLGRVAPQRLLVFSVAVGAVRWTLTAALHDPLTLVLVQALHGISFGVFWIAGVELMRAQAPRNLLSSAQALLVTATYGMGSLLSSALAGALLDRAGTTGVFAASAGASVLATGLALVAARRV